MNRSRQGRQQASSILGFDEAASFAQVLNFKQALSRAGAVHVCRQVQSIRTMCSRKAHRSSSIPGSARRNALAGAQHRQRQHICLGARVDDKHSERAAPQTSSSTSCWVRLWLLLQLFKRVARKEPAAVCGCVWHCVQERHAAVLQLSGVNTAAKRSLCSRSLLHAAHLMFPPYVRSPSGLVFVRRSKAWTTARLCLTRRPPATRCVC
jgi:hypothetical protein